MKFVGINKTSGEIVIFWWAPILGQFIIMDEFNFMSFFVSEMRLLKTYEILGEF